MASNMTRVDHLNVLITGMGPYPDSPNSHIDPNTSHVVTTKLPRTLEPNTAQNPSPVRINLVTFSEPIKTEYGYIRKWLKDMHQIYADEVDVFIHIGEARGQPNIWVERIALKQGMDSSWDPLSRNKYYTTPDNAGQTVDDIGPCPWRDLPMGLSSSLNIDNVVNGAMEILKTSYRFHKPEDLHASVKQADQSSPVDPDFTKPINVIPHLEAGSYCCGFTSYESLANRYSLGLDPACLWIHMPGADDDAMLKRVGNGILAIAVSAAYEVMKKKVERPKEESQ